MARLTYMDEAGTSAHEPFAVVSAAIIHADEQLHRVREYLSHLIVKHIPENDRDKFVFHAKDIWQGTKYFKGWDFEKRIAILDDLASTPSVLKIPIAIGVVKKEGKDNTSDAPKLSKDDYCHALAFAQCCGMIERFMREKTNENTILVVEDQPTVRAALNEVIEFIRSQTPADSEYFPLTRIQEMPLFANKKQSPALQIADMCAFFARGRLSLPKSRHELIIRWWSILERQMVDLKPLGKPNPAMILAPVSSAESA